MNNKAELLSKIKKLAEAGFYGEQTNAAEILERLKKKYGITDADIAEDVETIIWIRYKTKLASPDKNNLPIIRMLILTLIYQFIIKGYGGKNDIRYI